MRNKLSKPVPIVEQPIYSVELTRQQIIRKQLKSVEDQIVNELQVNHLTVNKAKIPFLSSIQKQSKQLQAYEKLLSQKKQMQEKIKQLQTNEKIYMEKSRIFDKNNGNSTYVKSEITLEDKQNIKKLKKKLEKFQNNILKKDKQVQQAKIKAAKQQQQKLLHQRMILNERKKIKIKQKLLQLKQRNIQRQQKMKSEQLILKKIEQKKKLHDILDQNWKQKNNQQQQKKLELMTLRLKQKQINFSYLKQHEKKYKQTIQYKRRQLQEKRLGSSRQSCHNSFSGQKSKYYTLVLKEQQQIKLQQEKKKEKRKYLQQRREQYAKYVREQLAPPLKQSQDEQQRIKNKQDEPKIIRLTKQEIVEMGNANLIQGNRKAKKKQNRDNNSKSLSEQEAKKNGTSTISHKSDYLGEIRKAKIQQKYYSGFYNSPKNEAQRIMNNSSIKKEDKIGKLRLLASRFDSNTPDIISKIQGKLQILEVIN